MYANYIMIMCLSGAITQYRVLRQGPVDAGIMSKEGRFWIIPEQDFLRIVKYGDYELS